MCTSFPRFHHHVSAALAALALMNGVQAIASGPTVRVDSADVDSVIDGDLEVSNETTSESFELVHPIVSPEGDVFVPIERPSKTTLNPAKYEHIVLDDALTNSVHTHSHPDAAVLRMRAQQSHNRAIAGYILGGFPAATGLALIAAGRCHYSDSPTGYLCLVTDGYGRQRRTLSGSAIAGITLVGVGVIPALTIGLNAQRRSLRQERLADAIDAGDLPNFSLVHYDAERMHRRGRNMHYTAAGTALGVVALSVAAVKADDPYLWMFRYMGAVTLGLASGGFLLRGAGLHRRAQQLETRALPRNAFTTTVIPRFLGDGAGADLHMSF